MGRQPREPNMNIYRTVLCAVAVLGMLACSKKDDEDGKQPAASASASAPAPSASAAEPKAEPGPAIEPRVKSEVDGRPDGITGSPMAATGATAALQTPKGWAPAKGEITVVTAPDKKAQLAVGAFDPAEGAAPKLPAAVTALGLTDCQWSPPEPLTVGRTKLAATGADGVCKRGKTVVRTAYVAPTAEKLLVVGAWDPDGDATSVFGAMRSIAKATGDSSGIAACCAALRQNARSAPPDQAPYLVMAASMCDGMRSSPQGRQALAQIRAGLRGANVPSSCR